MQGNKLESCVSFMGGGVMSNWPWLRPEIRLSLSSIP